ncbi:MAG: glycosyltransferase family 4 protein [Ketobacter sp.]|nr:glycosyltransferase family 4 protein [Ketobacter sp.]
MKLGISAWRLSGPRFGVARYTDYLVTALSKQLTAQDSIVLFSPTAIDPPIQSKGNAPVVERQVRPRLTNALWENLLLPKASRDMDIVLGPSYTLPLLGRGKKVVAIHSVNEAEQGQHSLWYKLTYSLKYRLSAKVADRVIVNSQSTKDRVVDYYGIAPEKVEVVWLGVDDSFRPYDAEIAASNNRKTKLHYLGEDCPYVLFVGTMSARRNVPLLMQAFGAAKKRYNLPHKLFVVGNNIEHIPLDKLAAEFDITDSFVHFGGSFPHHGDIIPIYNGADLFVLPSNTEGFSLTLPEAMACGVPAITSANSSLGEVANGYAHTLEDINLESLSEAMGQVLCDRELHEKLKQQGLERAKDLRWDKCARKTLAILQHVVSA